MAYCVSDVLNRSLPSDNRTLKAVLSDTRLQILKNLNKRRMTAAELVSSIGVQKNALYKHLDKLINAELIKRVDNEKRKWVYYELTSKGANIISSGKYQVLILLSSGIGTLLIGISLAALYLLREIQPPKTRGLAISQLDIGVILVATSIVLLLITWFVSRNRWKRITKNLHDLGE